MNVLEQIRGLDPVRDCERIVHLSVCWDFPVDTPRALELALFRTFAVPSISGLLDHTGEFRERAQKRYDDTDVLIAEMMVDGFSGPRGAAALARMNEIHGRFKIAQADLLYVLTTFIYEPIRWIDRYGWRPLEDVERLGYFHFWRNIGLRMGIQDVPDDFKVLEAYNVDYEARHFRYAETNARVGLATRELFVSWYPRPLAPLVRAAVHAMLEDHLREAFGFPAAPAPVRAAVRAVLAVRRRVLALLPAPRVAALVPTKPRPTYPAGYEIGRIGPG